MCAIGLIAAAGRFETGPPQIWPHLPALLVGALLRFAAFAIQNRSARSGAFPALFGIGIFSGFRMKEHDA
jgi:hypothetical protein